MTRTWLSIRVDLVEGRGERMWPRPGRIFAAALSHTFAALATAIDDAFALAYWGWGAIPDQYGRRWDGDDGEHRLPRDPRGTDLPPLRPGWGRARRT
ncbi:MAG: hypothetical protein HY264_02965 [Chloroflexi bacterium]|nr:hypothetical protein [Chloroflexota bacterium]